MGLGLDDLADASRPDAVLRSQLDFVPGAAAQVLQFEGALGGADEHVFPLLRVVHGVLEHEACAERERELETRPRIIPKDLLLDGGNARLGINACVPALATRGHYHTAPLAASPKSAPDWRTVSLPPLVTYNVQNWEGAD